MRGRPSSAPRSSPPPVLRPATPSRRPYTPNKPSTPPRSLTPTFRSNSTGSSGQTSSNARRGTSPVKASSGSSASPKLRGWQKNPDGLSNTPPNLRTSLPERPTAHPRGLSPSPRNGRDSSLIYGRRSMSPTASGSASSSHSHERDHLSTYSRGSRASSGDDDVDSRQSSSVGISTGLAARKIGVGNNKTMSFTKKPSRTISSSSAPKRSFDSALRQMAIDTRDALAKSIYASLFECLVELINKSLEVGKRRSGKSISILDIYGFESFDKNSFEQFCINYANERLQQHFNRHLFKLEQEEYINDGIDWAKVDFEDNQACLNLFEKKPLGLLSLLDEESTFPNGSDHTFANKLKQHLNSNSCFRGERGDSFAVNHYAGEVVYETSGFLEKNRDLLHMGPIQLLASCTCRLPQIFASKMLNQSEKALGNVSRLNGVDSQKLSVATKFKGELFKLMNRLGTTTPHFIRCIKPNNSQRPATYEQTLVLQQLRCCGVLEVVRISRSGFPTRMTHEKFARRYGFLLLESVASQDPLSVSVAILQQFNILPEMYQVGYTKLFFRTGQVGALEDTRNRTLHGILRVQSCFRGHQARRYVKDRYNGILTLQSFIRAEKTRQVYSGLLKRNRAAIVLQRARKAQIARRHFVDVRNSAVLIQSVIRGWLVRRSPGDVNLLNTSSYEGTKGDESGQVLVKASVLTELQRRILKAESALRHKEEENEILQQKLQQYETRWSEYELKMRTMEEVWQKQMRSLQSSLSIAKRTLSADEPERKSDASVDQSWDNTSVNHNGTAPDETPSRPPSRFGERDMNAGMSIIGRLAEEFEQRSQIFADDAKFLVEVKSGQAEASLNPERELRRLKQSFDVWKKDFNVRLRESKVIIHKLGSDETAGPVKKWWGRINSGRM